MIYEIKQTLNKFGNPGTFDIIQNTETIGMITDEPVEKLDDKKSLGLIKHYENVVNVWNYRYTLKYDMTFDARKKSYKISDELKRIDMFKYDIKQGETDIGYMLKSRVYKNFLGKGYGLYELSLGNFKYTVYTVQQMNLPDIKKLDPSKAFFADF